MISDVDRLSVGLLQILQKALVDLQQSLILAP
jgi:hypothetical protein